MIALHVFMIQVSISLVVMLHLRPLRSTDRAGVYTEQALILSDVTTKLLVTWIVCDGAKVEPCAYVTSLPKFSETDIASILK